MQAQYIEIDEYGNKYYYKDREMKTLHRSDGPAVERVDGGKSWRIDGKLHRIDGPAVEYADGYKAWYIDGKRHRTDGPAIEDVRGYKSWYLSGEKLSEEEYKRRTSLEVVVTLDEIARKFGVDVSKLKIVKERFRYKVIIDHF